MLGKDPDGAEDFSAGEHLIIKQIVAMVNVPYHMANMPHFMLIKYIYG